MAARRDPVAHAALELREVRVEGETVWSRKEDGGFPDLPELKRLVRDRVAPSRHLGHTEKADAAG